MSRASRVAAFTDTYLPTVNGVTYTVATWQEQWEQRGGRMAVAYPSSEHAPDGDEHPVGSLPFPFYEGFRFAAPRVPRELRDAQFDVVHTHTPFMLGLGALRFAGRTDTPFVASYHTPAAEYADYLLPGKRPPALLRGAARRYEQWFYDRADAVVVPSEITREHLRERGLGPVEVVPNGVDVERFQPTDPAAFCREHGLDDADALVGYTGRHGYEKRLSDLVAAAEDLDATVVFGGDGPAREQLEAQAATLDADVRFLGFLDREELSAFYSAIDVFAFPSPVETQGLVALEANACGTPVAGADSGALADTVVDGETGYQFATGDPDALRDAVERALADADGLREGCLARREEYSVDSAMDRLAEVYASL